MLPGGYGTREILQRTFVWHDGKHWQKPGLYDQALSSITQLGIKKLKLTKTTGLPEIEQKIEPIVKKLVTCTADISASVHAVACRLQLYAHEYQHISVLHCNVVAICENLKKTVLKNSPDWYMCNKIQVLCSLKDIGQLMEYRSELTTTSQDGKAAAVLLEREVYEFFIAHTTFRSITRYYLKQAEKLTDISKKLRNTNALRANAFRLYASWIYQNYNEQKDIASVRQPLGSGDSPSAGEALAACVFAMLCYVGTCSDGTRKTIVNALTRGEVNFALRVMSKLGAKSVVSMMLKYESQLKLNLNATGASRKTARDYAIEANNTEIVRLLEERMQPVTVNRLSFC